jgi:hypothetical protein
MVDSLRVAFIFGRGLVNYRLFLVYGELDLGK